MKNWLLKKLFPKEYSRIKFLIEGQGPDISLSGVWVRDIQIYVIPDGSSYTVNCTWKEYSFDEGFGASVLVEE